jgi:single-strand DNA-binding protein
MKPEDEGGEHEDMRSVNRIILVGNATRDAELRHTKTDKPVSNLRLATNRRVGGEESTQFHTIVCWEGLAETTGAYVKKGDLLYVEGRLEYRTFTDEEGKERGAVEIVANDVQFLSKRGGSHGQPDEAASDSID